MSFGTSNGPTGIGFDGPASPSAGTKMQFTGSSLNGSIQAGSSLTSGMTYTPQGSQSEGNTLASITGGYPGQYASLHDYAVVGETTAGVIGSITVPGAPGWAGLGAAAIHGVDNYQSFVNVAHDFSPGSLSVDQASSMLGALY